MSALYLGVDPGLHGGLAILDDTGYALGAWVMPLIGREIDGPGIVRLLDAVVEPAVGHHLALAAIEHVGAMPGQGVTSMFTFGAGWGLVRGILLARGLSTQLVRPMLWKRAVLAGLPHDKDGALRYCTNRWPEVSLIPPRCHTPHDGLADALCLAEYARRLGVQGAA